MVASPALGTISSFSLYIVYMLDKLRKFTGQNRILIFLLLSLALLLTYPVFKDLQFFSLIHAAIYTLVLLAGVNVTSKARQTQFIGAILGVITIILNLIDGSILQTRELKMLMLLSYFLFFSFIAIIMISTVVRSKKVDAEMIYGAIAGYLLIGLSGAMLLALMELFDHTAFSLVVMNNEYHEFIYFSYVTLATLGYGDIVPTKPLSQIFSVILSISGQLYLTILIAMIVGKYIKNDSK